MLRLTDLRLPLDHPEPALRAAVLSRLALPDEALRAMTVVRRAWDARKKSAVVLIYTLDCTLDSPDTEAALLAGADARGERDLRPAPDTRYRLL
ncbi:MAG: hypothetical protein LW768_21135, partial [Rubrivivax sp.]|nr:hypothetical protein [Rubrivivax sp.]